MQRHALFAAMLTAGLLAACGGGGGDTTTTPETPASVSVTGIAAKGLDYQGASAPAKAALKVFSDQVAQLSPVAYQLQGYTSNRVIFNAVISRLGQAISGEGSLDEAFKRIESDIAQQIAERKK